MNDDLQRTMGRAQKKADNAIEVKGMLKSVTLWGVALALLGRFAGVEMTVEDGQTLSGQAMVAWPLLVALVADLKVAWGRMTAVTFDKRWWQSGNFWATLVAAVMSVLAALKVNWEGIEDLPEQVAGVVMVVGSLAGALLQWWGRARAKKLIAVGGLPRPNGFVALGFDFGKVLSPVKRAMESYFRARIHRLGSLDGKAGFSYGDVKVMLQWVGMAEEMQVMDLVFLKLRDATGREKHEAVLSKVLHRFGEQGANVVAVWAAPLIVNYVHELAVNTGLVKKK